MIITSWRPTPSNRMGCGKTLVRQMRPLRGVGAADELPPDCHALGNTNSAQLDHTILYRRVTKYSLQIAMLRRLVLLGEEEDGEKNEV